METIEQISKNTHHGHAIKRYRHTLGIKQEALAADMGISQALISFYEKKKVIEDDMVEKIAKALNVALELIKELEEGLSGTLKTNPPAVQKHIEKLKKDGVISRKGSDKKEFLIRNISFKGMNRIETLEYPVSQLFVKCP